MSVTVSDEECIDTFLYDVLQAEDYCVKWDKKDVFGEPSDIGLQPLFKPFTKEQLKKLKVCIPTLGDYLSESDKELLEEYVARLFNTIPEPSNNLVDAIYTLTVLIRSYRDAERERRVFEKQFDEFNDSMRSNKGKKSDIESFRKNITRIMHLLGGKMPDGKGGYTLAITPKAEPLVEALHEAYKNPDDYFPKNPKYTISKSPILEYLNSLDLPDKSDSIKEFMKKV